ncbi:MAG: hypothetical protein MJ094_06930 [Saccharofermentans sp.]|nr:hypothetical protein [Saccharofermentans sp.]
MKKIVSLLVTATLVVSTLTCNLLASETEINPEAGNPHNNTNVSTVELAPSGSVYGRFVVPSVDINIALYKGSQQSIIDAYDSGCFYRFNGISGMTIADHHHQEFATLTDVTVGTTAIIEESNGGRIYLECVEVVDGINAGASLTYANGELATSRNDYLTYTCLPGAGNIRICQWNITSTENIDAAYEASYNVDTATIQKLTSAMVVVSEDPTLEDTVIEEPVVEEEETVIEEPTVDETVVEQPTVDEPVASEPTVDNGNSNGNGHGNGNAYGYNNGNAYGHNNGNNGRGNGNGRNR